MRLAVLFSSFLFLTACGGSVDSSNDNGPVNGPSGGADDTDSTPLPTREAPPAMAFFAPDDHLCARASSNGGAEDLKPKDASEDIAVVELTVADECTNLGGQYLLASDLHSSKKFWLGGHGCRQTKFLSGAATSYGVLRYVATSSVLTIPAGVCVAFPGTDNGQPITTPTKVRTVAVFASQAQAETFAKSLRP